MAWQQTRGSKTRKTCRAVFREPAGREELWRDAMETFLRPLLPAIHASRLMLPEAVRPAWQSQWNAWQTGCTYVGLNVTPDLSWDLPNFTWEGTYDEATGKHHGIREWAECLPYSLPRVGVCHLHCMFDSRRMCSDVHIDQNNAEGKLGAIIPLGAFEGFFQHMLPYAISIACPHLGVLWADTSKLLHCVSEGSGCRISLVVCNHEFGETGFRGQSRVE